MKKNDLYIKYTGKEQQLKAQISRKRNRLSKIKEANEEILSEMRSLTSELTILGEIQNNLSRPNWIENGVAMNSYGGYRESYALIEEEKDTYEEMDGYDLELTIKPIVESTTKWRAKITSHVDRFEFDDNYLPSDAKEYYVTFTVDYTEKSKGLAAKNSEEALKWAKDWVSTGILPKALAEKSLSF
jgi:hypothetical protein